MSAPAPVSARARVAANLAALRLLRELQAEDRPAGTLEEQHVLAGWSGWGAVPQVFDEARAEYAGERAELRSLLTEVEWRAAARTTLSAFYTDPRLVRAVWGALSDHGFPHGGRVLEPGCGAGVFLGHAPDAAGDLVGVELDPTTAAVAAALHPHAQVRAESFADTRLPSSSFDLAIGNVPFADVVLYDPVHNPGRQPIHTHFILKSLALTRPGGVVAVITSRWTMDTANPAGRRAVAEQADLIAAIRLPGAAFTEAAGTSVVTDLLVLRRRDPSDPPGEQSGWEQAVPLQHTGAGGGEGEVRVNSYFAEHAEAVLGELGTRLGRFGPELTVSHATGDVGELAGELRTRLDAALTAPGQPLFTATSGPVTERAALALAAPDAVDGHLAGDSRAGFTVVLDGQLAPHPVPASQARELSALLGLRDTVLDLLSAEAATLDDTPAIGALRAQLNTRYDDYTARFGPINRVKLRPTGRTDPDTGQPKLARIRPGQGGFRTDPHAVAVYALEHYDPELDTAQKASIFTERVVAPRQPRLGADSPADALAICLDSHGRVDLPVIARLLGTTEHEARSGLAGLVFPEPAADGELVPAVQYLSGNVRVKLAQAREAAAAAGDDRWAGNIAALQEVVPTDLTAAEITVRFGAAWIPAPVVEQFLQEILDDPSVQVEHAGGSMWAVRGRGHTVLATSTYGTERASAISLTQACLEQRPVRVFDELPGGVRVLNMTETAAAQEKAGELQEAFADWLWTDPTRTRELVQAYNEMFNAIVLRSYDGQHRDLPGLAVSIQLRPHQIAAVNRMVSEPTAGLFHEVGAGKTLEMICGAMELRRLGLARKIAVVVPNHMLEQFSREWLQAYPQAKILAAGTEDLAGPKRRLLVARVATGDWDAVILSRSAFERIPLTPAAQQAYYDHELAELRARLANSRDGRGLSVKRLEGALARAEARLDKLTGGQRDDGVSFEQTGIDYVIVDEGHGYKNLATASNIPGAGIEGSQRASDLDMKLHHLRGRHGGRVATIATATPIANSIAELYVMQRYLQPEVLAAAGLTDFDTWAATFGETVTALELSPDGSRYRMQSRFAKFVNVPELLRMFHQVADIKTAEDLQLPTPGLIGGNPETIVVDPSPELRAFMASLVGRAEAIQARRVDREVDNMLRVASHGRMAALDLRLLPDAELTADDRAVVAAGLVEGKLAAAADRIAGIHHTHAARAYPGQARPGALQLVFCDLGTPTGHGWNAYAELRQLLVERGVPAGMVRFMHEARTDREKGQLFAAARAGKIAVLIGSTEKMGVGTNVQLRAIALHHLDCPWRPADLAQRDGRILRQGNLNPEVHVIRVVTGQSFDAFTWGAVERKARFIGQILKGKLDVREVEDVSDVAMSYAEVKALATGDERILEAARLESEIARLDRLQRAHHRNQQALRATVTGAEEDLPVLQRELAALTAAAELRIDTRGDAFAMAVAGRPHTQRPAAAAHLVDQLTALYPASPVADVGRLAGFTVQARAERIHGELHYQLTLAAVPGSQTLVKAAELKNSNNLGLISRLENQAARIPTARDQVAAQLQRTSTERDRAAAGLGQAFPHAEALAAARVRAGELQEQFQAEAAAAEQASHRGTAAARPVWTELVDQLHPGTSRSDSWTPLQAALDRAQDAGVDPAGILRQLVTEEKPAGHDPAGDLLWRLYERCEAAAPDTGDLPPAAAVIVGAPPEPPRPPAAPQAGIAY